MAVAFAVVGLVFQEQDKPGEAADEGEEDGAEARRGPEQRDGAGEPAGRDLEALTVVYSSASTQYLSDDDYARLRDAIRAEGDRVTGGADPYAGGMALAI